MEDGEGYLESIEAALEGVINSVWDGRKVTTWGVWKNNVQENRRLLTTCANINADRHFPQISTKECNYSRKLRSESSELPSWLGCLLGMWHWGKICKCFIKTLPENKDNNNILMGVLRIK